MRDGQNHGLDGLRDDTDYTAVHNVEDLTSVESLNPWQSVIQNHGLYSSG